MIQRQGLIVWLYTLKHLKSIRKFGHIHYISQKLKYVVLYVNAEQEEEVMRQLERQHFVRLVEPSHRNEIDMTFKDAIPDRLDPDSQVDNASSEEDFKTFLSGLASSLDLPVKEQTASEEPED